MQGKDIVLGLLNQKERTGYEIKEVLETQLSYFFDASNGMIYPTLRKLESEGKIIKERVYQDDKPNKNVYSITDAGRQEFTEYLNSPTSGESYKSDFLMRLYFGKGLSKEKIVNFILNEIEQKKSNLLKLRTEYLKWKNNGMDELQNITYCYGIAYFEAEVRVLSDALDNLNK